MEDYDFDINDGFAPEDIPDEIPYRPPVDRNSRLDRDRYRPPQDPQQRPDHTPDSDTDDDEAVLLEENDTRHNRRGRNSERRQEASTGKKTRDAAPDQEKPRSKPKRKREEAPGPARPNIFIRFVTDERTHIFLGIAFLLISVLVVIALFSYFHHPAEDQSKIINMSLSELSKDPSLIDNNAGGFGAKLSYWLMCDALGLGSLVFIVYLWILSFALFGLKKIDFWGVTFRVLLLAVTISIVLGYITFNIDSEIYWGGTHGHYINKVVMDNVKWVGSFMLSLMLVCAVCCVYLNELRKAWKKWRIALANRRERMRAERERLRKLAARTKEIKLDLDEDEDYNFDEDEEEAGNVAQSPAKKTELKPIVSPLTDSLKALAGRLAGREDREDKTPQDISHADNTAIITDETAPDTQVTGDSTGDATSPAAPAAVAHAAAGGPQVTAPTITATPTSQSLDIDHSKAGVATAPSTSQDIDHKDHAIHDINIDEPHDTATESDGQDDNFKVYVPEIELADDAESAPAPAKADPTEPFDHRAELSRYRFPTIGLLEERESGPVIDMEEQQANKERIEKTLLDYKIPISRIEATVGPTVTLYEIVPAEGVRISQIKRLEDDIALSLAALGIRIIAPIPGKGTVGIEVPNREPRTVSIRSVISSKKYQECKMALPMAMGATISNDIFIADLAKMPHLLVAGATGMGKSVGLNTIIASLLYKKHPTELKFVLVDPKMVEFSLYSKLERHYLAKLPGQGDAIITDMRDVITTLNSLCQEMDDRYELLRDANVRSLEEYNKKFTERRLLPSKGHRYLPYIVVVVDEFADLIMTQGREVETPISRIAQKARAVGIHMILATQRPSTNVITGLIKANFPGRIAFRVIQMVDSRTILDCPGANQLIGRGDMLFSHNGIMERVQCAFMSTVEVETLTEYIDNQAGFEHAYYLPEPVMEEAEGGAIAGASTDRDALFNEAARFVVTRQMGSTSSLQRQFGVGYNRAGKLMDQMEAAGIVGPVNGSKPRNILVDIVTLESMLGD